MVCRDWLSAHDPTKLKVQLRSYSKLKLAERYSTAHHEILWYFHKCFASISEVINLVVLRNLRVQQQHSNQANPAFVAAIVWPIVVACPPRIMNHM